MPELEAEIFHRIQAIEGAPQIPGGEYREVIRRSVSAGVEYAVTAVELGEQQLGPVPLALLNQARLAARFRISLGAMLRGYVAGKHLLTGRITKEAARHNDLWPPELEKVLTTQAVVFDRLLAELEDEYEREARRYARSPGDSLVERVKGLLAGEPVDTNDLLYNFGDHHVGVVAEGDLATKAIRDLAALIDAQPLIAEPGGGVIWAWLGTRRPVCRQLLGRVAASCWPATFPVGFGEPDQGLAGWRTSHRQARAIAPAARHKRNRIARYAEDGISAAIERDALLVASLRKLYLDPLEGEGGLQLVRTLRAYLNAGGNGASAAAALGLTRQTVSNHVKRIEEKLGRSLLSGTADIEIALRIASPERSTR